MSEVADLLLKFLCLQVGVPFSDPLADGGTIQKANEVALHNNVSLRMVLDFVRQARAAGVTVPIVLMGYYNPILAYGESVLAKDAAAAGVDGFIVVDLPPEDATTFVTACDAHGLGYIPLAAPTSTDARLKSIGAVARGFLYCVSVTGVTGARSSLPPDLAAFVQRLRTHVPPSVPLAVGFGLSTREHVQEVAKLGVDGVVMGSAIVKALEAGGVPAMTEFLKSVL